MELSKLPGKKELLGAFVGTLNGIPAAFVRAHNAIAEKHGIPEAAPAKEEAPAPDAEAPKAEAPAEAPAAAPEAAPAEAAPAAEEKKEEPPAPAEAPAA